MRTTINLPDVLARDAKARAVSEGRTFTSLVEEGLRWVLAEPLPDRSGPPEALPAFGDPADRLLVDPADRDALWAALDGERGPVILPDVNVLVYAFRREAENHGRYAAWLADVVAGSDEIALHDPVLIGFVRIVTNSRVVPTPASTALALDFVARIRGARRARWVPPGPAGWERLGQLVGWDRGISANLVPDAHLAAVALTHGCRLATADRGFARFPGLDWYDPAA